MAKNKLRYTKKAVEDLGTRSGKHSVNHTGNPEVRKRINARKQRRAWLAANAGLLRALELEARAEMVAEQLEADERS